MERDKKCKPKDDREAVVTISDSLLKRLQEGPSGKDDAKRRSKKMMETEEEWMKKLKCMEDYHTNVRGLTMANFEKLLSSTERQIAMASKDNQPCHKKVLEVIKCYQQCVTRTLNCVNEVQDFIDCVDETKKEMETNAKNKNKMKNTFDSIPEQPEPPLFQPTDNIYSQNYFSP